MQTKEQLLDDLIAARSTFKDLKALADIAAQVRDQAKAQAAAANEKALAAKAAYAAADDAYQKARNLP